MSGRRRTLSASGRSRDSERGGRLFGRRSVVATPRRRARLSTRLVGRRAEVAIPRRRARQSTLRPDRAARGESGGGLGSGTAGEGRCGVAPVGERAARGERWHCGRVSRRSGEGRQSRDRRSTVGRVELVMRAFARARLVGEGVRSTVGRVELVMRAFARARLVGEGVRPLGVAARAARVGQSLY